MNINILAFVKIIFSSKHEHHHLVKAIPHGIHPLECYKYKNNKAIRIPCNEVPKSEDTTSNDISHREYVSEHGRPVYLTDDSIDSSKYLNPKGKEKHKKYVKDKLRNIDKTGESVSREIKKISRKLKGLPKKENDSNKDSQSSSSSSCSSDGKKQKTMNSLIEKKLKNINKSVYERFVRALRRYKKKFNDKRSYDLKRILMFILEMEKRKKQETPYTKGGTSNPDIQNQWTDNLKPERNTEYEASTPNRDSIPINDIKRASENMGNEFQKTIEGLLSHISDSGLDNIFSQWGELSNKTRSKKKRAKKFLSNENKSLVESLNAKLGILNDNCLDLPSYPDGFENQMIYSLTSLNDGYPLIPPRRYPISPNNYSQPPPYFVPPPANYSVPAPTPLQTQSQLNYTPPTKYSNSSQFATKPLIYPSFPQKSTSTETNFQNIPPAEIFPPLFTNFNNLSPLYSKPPTC